MNALTALGPIPADDLGLTLMHEHLLFDFRDYWRPPDAAGDLALADAPLRAILVDNPRRSLAFQGAAR